MRRWLAIGIAASTFLIGAAFGGTVSRFIVIPRGSSADFRTSAWACLNQGRTVLCRSGDAHPYVTLGVDPRVVALRVYSAGRPCPVRRVRREGLEQGTYFWEYRYTFRSLGCG
jgi:hypothetical protein